MIERERLRELIEQVATIYEVKYGKINPVSLKNKIRFISEKYPVIVFEPRPNEKYKHHKYFDKLFETLEEAEWHKEFGCIERTERLELPPFEEVNEDLDGRTGDFVVADPSEFTFSIRKSFTDQILLQTQYEKYNWNFNKENYILACRKAKELFLGE